MHAENVSTHPQYTYPLQSGVYPIDSYQLKPSRSSRFQSLPVLAWSRPKYVSLACCLAAAVFMWLLTPHAALAQFNAALSGTVQDTSGAVIANAQVTLTNDGTAAVKSITTAPSGFYSFNELAPGTYTLSATAAGFEPQNLAGIQIAAEGPRNINIKMKAGGSLQTVTISANDTPVLDTADGNVGTTITSADVTRLPTFGRDPYELLRLTPGTTMDAARSGTGGSVALPNNTGTGQSNYGIFQTENQIQASAVGQRDTSNSFLIDGVSVDSLVHGGSAIITPNPESVAQISGVSSNFDASYGRNVGEIIQTVTKSGSNTLHGSAFFQYDQPGLNAYNPYGGPSGALPVRVENKQREWAGSIGFPIRKDKLFFFGSYEGVSNQNNSFSTQYVPTPQFLSALGGTRGNGIVGGTLSASDAVPRVIQVLATECQNVQPNPALTAANPNPTPVCQQVTGGVDIGSITGTLNSFPANATVGGGLDGIPDVQFAQIETPARFRGNQFNARGDWNIGPRDQFAASAFIVKLDQTSGDASTGAEPLANVPFKPFNSSGTLVYIHTFSNTLTNEARGNYTRFADNQVNDSAGVVNWGVPRLEVQGFTFGRLEAGAPESTDEPGILAQDTYEFRDLLIQTFGAHTLRYGFQYRWEQDNDNLGGLARPDYVFQGLWNFANDAPIFEQIAVNPSTGGAPNAKHYFRDHDIAGFIQHDWKVGPTLTFNTGLRWEYFEPLYNKGFSTYEPVFSPSPATYLTSAYLAPRNHLFNSNYNNWGPKLSFAWNPSQHDSKFVLRGGFGISYDRLDDELFINSYQNGPAYFQFGLCCASATQSLEATHITFEKGTTNSPFSYTPNPYLNVGINPTTGIPNGAGEIDVYGTSNHTAQPILYSTSLQIEYQLPYQLVASIGYQGSIGQHFPRLVDQNFLYQTAITTGAATVTTPFSNAYVPTTDVYTNYNGVNLSLSKRFSHGYNMNAFYTYSKSMDQLSSEGPGANSNQTDPANPASEYGPSDFDVRHRVTVSGNWDLPKYHNGRGPVGEILSGWQANMIYTYHTGFPWTPVTGVPSVQFVSTSNTIEPTRPTAYSGGAHVNCSNSLFTNGTDFPAVGGIRGPSYFTIGTPGPPGIGRNSFSGPCYMDTDISVAREQPFSVAGHEARFRFQANGYNVFNKENLAPITFGSPEATVENTLFGLSPTADAGRVIEFFARIDF